MTVPCALGGMNCRPVRALRKLLQRRRRATPATRSVTSASVNAWRANGGGLTRQRLRRPGLLALEVGRRHRPLLDREQRLARLAVEQEHVAGLGGLRDGVDRLAVVRHRHEHRRRRAGRDPTGRGARTGSARRARRWRPSARAGSWRTGSRRGDCRPRSRRPPSPWAGTRGRASSSTLMPLQALAPPTRVPGVGRPGVVAELARLRDGVEDPADLAGAHVVGADVARRRRARALGHARAEDQQVLVDRARACSRGRRGSRTSRPRPSFRLDAALVAEGRDGLAGPARRARRGAGRRRRGCAGRRRLSQKTTPAVDAERAGVGARPRTDRRSTCARRWPRRARTP